MARKRTPWSAGDQEQSTKRWRHVKYDGPVPDSAAIAIERALLLAITTGKATNRVEAHEAIAASAYTEWLIEAEAMKKSPDPDKREAYASWLFRQAVMTRDHWRCQETGTSQNLTVHHIYTRGWCRDNGREDLLTDPRNGITLSWDVHNQIQKHWRVYVGRYKARAKANQAAADAG